MAEYNRKKVKKQRVRAPKHERVVPVAPKKTPARDVLQTEKIRMKPQPNVSHKKTNQKPIKKKTPDKKTTPNRVGNKKNYLKIIKGNKEKIKAKSIATAVIVLVLIIGILSLIFCAPVNIIEASGNMIAKIGSGSGFPTSLTGGQTIDVRVVNSLTYVLSDTNVEVFNSNGKNVISIQHSMTNPALSISEGRALIYEIGGKKYQLFNLSGVISQENTKREIIAADVSRSGRIAIATKSDKYAAEVEVLAVDGSSVYTWYSSSAVISDVALSANGRRLAVATISVNGGEYFSTVNVLKYDSPTPIVSHNYDGAVYSLDTVSNSRFTITLSNGIDFCYFKNKAPVKQTFSYETSLLRFEYGSYVAVCNNRVGNKNDNSIIIFDVKGKKISDVNINKNITDFRYYGRKLFCLTDSGVSSYDLNSTLLKSAECDFGPVRLGNVSANKVAVVWDNKINVLDLHTD